MGSIYPPSHSVLNMPIPGTKLAPEKFKGEYNLVQRFIQHYERLCDQHNVTKDTDKCETITQYCSKKVGEFIEALDSYTTSNWNQLKRDLLKFYDDDRSSKRYRQKDLITFTEETKLKKIKDLSTWKRYTRGFVRIGGWLKSKTKISEEEHATYFWQGIPRTLRVRIENRLLAQHPTRSLATAWPVKDVETAAEAILQRDRFDRNYIDSDEEGKDATDSGESEDEADSEDEESEAELKRLKKQTRRLKELAAAKKAKKKAGARTHLDSDDEEPQSKKGTSAKKVVSPVKTSDHSEVEDLINQLNTMPLNDPSYGFIYFKAIKLDRDVEKVVRRPSIGNANGNSTRGPPPSNQGFQRDPPPHLNSQTAPPSNEFAQRPPMRCYGCGETGHGLFRCEQINELLKSGVLAKDQMGRIVRGDGTILRRITPDEPFISVIERDRISQAPQTNLVTFQDLDQSFLVDNRGYESDEVNVEGAWITELDSEGEKQHFVYPVETRKRETAGEARKRAGNKNYPEPLPPGTAKGKERMAQTSRQKEKEQSEVPTHRYVTRNRSQDQELEFTDNPDHPNGSRVQSKVPKHVPIEVSSKPKEKRVGIDPIPVEIRARDWNPEDDREMIEDLPDTERSADKEQTPAPPLIGKSPERKKPSPRKSAVSAHVDPMAVLTRLLSAPVQLQVGEVLGVSREVSGLLTDSIKFKSGNPLVASSFITRTRGVLIKLQMECDGKPLTAIIDTGSQLNIVSKPIWKTVINRPMDIAKTLSMNDANGGEGILRGLVQHVPLTCGQVYTQANLYVGEHVPFELLLGRPWQRGNYVSIDERIEGTYLLFKDPTSLQVRFEVMVNQEPADPNWNFDPTLWMVPGGLDNLLITTETEAEPANLITDDRDCHIRKERAQTRKVARIFIWITRRVVALIFMSVIKLLQIVVKGFEGICNIVEDKESQGNKKSPINPRIQEFITNLPTSTDSPIITPPPTGQIINTFICENRSPVVPSTITSSFQDRTDIEIIGRIKSEMSYHKRTGFNNQGIIGAHTATELRPIYEGGRLARRLVLNDAVLITNADNSDPPNVMCGDIILKQYPNTPVTQRPLPIPVYNGPVIPPPRTTNFSDREVAEADHPEEAAEVFASFFSNTSVIDQKTSARNASAINAPVPNASERISARNASAIDPADPRINYTVSAGVPLSRKSSPRYSPTLIYPDDPIPFPTLNAELTEESESEVSDPESASRHLATEARSISGSILYLQTKLAKIEHIIRAREEIQACPETHQYHSCDDRKGKKKRIEVEEPVVYRSRRAKRREKERIRMEKLRGKERDEDFEMVDRECVEEVERVVNEVREQITTASSEDPHYRLYSDDENSPVRIGPPTRADHIFSDNPNMPALSFHISTGRADSNSTSAKADSVGQNHVYSNESASDSMPDLEDISSDDVNRELCEGKAKRVVYDFLSNKYYKIVGDADVGSETEISMSEAEECHGHDASSIPFRIPSEPFIPDNPFPQIRQVDLYGGRAISELGISGAKSVFGAWDLPVHKYFLRNHVAPAIPNIPYPNPFKTQQTEAEAIQASKDDDNCRICGTNNTEGTPGSQFEQVFNRETNPEAELPNKEGVRTTVRTTNSSDIFGGSDSLDSDSDDMRVDWNDGIPKSDPFPEHKGNNVQTEEDHPYASRASSLSDSELMACAGLKYLALQSAICLLLASNSDQIDMSGTRLIAWPNHSSSVILKNVMATIYDDEHHSHLDNPSIRGVFDALAIHNSAATSVPPPYPSTVPRHCHNWTYLHELKDLRGKIRRIINTAVDALDPHDWEDMYGETITLLIEDEEGFRETTMEIKEYFRQSGLIDNSFLLEHENHFLRRAADRFRQHGRWDLHDAIMDVLRVQVGDYWRIKLLVEAGYLEEKADVHAALHMLWVLERVEAI